MANSKMPDIRIRRAAAACYLAGLSGYLCLLPLFFLHYGLPVAVIGFAIAGFFLAPPLLMVGVWRSQRHLHPCVDESGRAVINLWLTLMLYQIITAVVLWFLTIAICGDSSMYTANAFQSYWGLFVFFGSPILAGVVGLIYGIVLLVSAAEMLSRGRVRRYRRCSRRFLR